MNARYYVEKEIESGVGHEKEIGLSVGLSRWTLGAIGTWPSSSSETRLELSLLNKILIGICYSLLASLLILGGMFIALELQDLYNNLKLSSALSFFLMAAVKYVVLILRQNKIRRCIERIETDWKRVRHLEDRRVMIENAHFGRKLGVVCALFMYGGVAFYYVTLPLTLGKIVEVENNLTYMRLVYPVPSIVADVRRSPANEIFYALQLLCGLVAHNVAVAACSLAALLVMHACGQLRVLVSWLEHLVDGREGVLDTIEQRLADIVEQHVRILSFIRLTENILQEISLVEMVGCTVNICCLGYYCMREWDFTNPIGGLTYLILLLSVTFNIFIFCYIGETLSEQTQKISEITYGIDWYRLPAKKGLATVLIIMMSNATTKMSAGNLFELSTRSFGDVIKTSGAYLNMLRTFTL